MSSRRRKAREAALKALYQNDLLDHDLDESLVQVVADEHLQPALEVFAREFILNSAAVAANAGEIEAFIRDFAGLPLVTAADPDKLREAVRGLIDDAFPSSSRTAIARSDAAMAALIERATAKAGTVGQLQEFAHDLVGRTQENRSQIDTALSKFADHWSLDRMASLDRSILRFATCELLFFPDIPVNVTINEAIEIAKKFSTERSCEFVNGILDKIQREMRPTKNDARKKADAPAEEKPSSSGDGEE